MKIHEYQAIEIYKMYGIPTVEGCVAFTPDEVREKAEAFGAPVVVKAQVHVGGRGKAGGVKLAQNPSEAEKVASEILGMDIKGLKVSKVLVSRAIQIQKEAYIGVTIDRASKKIVLIGTSEGGVEIEELARVRPDAIQKILVDPSKEVDEKIFSDMAEKIFSEEKLVNVAADILSKLYRVFIGEDCSLAEINPLVLDGSGNLRAADAKINFDDNALYKHPAHAELQDIDQENAKEIEAKKYGLSFVDLDGDIGCIVNGAGLAMATMDMIKTVGGQPANFLDVGGSSNPSKVLNAIRIILSNPRIKSIVINIFGGITRCDDIAKGLLEAINSLEIPVPIYVRLTGTNQEEAAEILKNTDLITASAMQDVIQKAVNLAKA
jgi:succinyl-CoA synthetase beta subunit